MRIFTNHRINGVLAHVRSSLADHGISDERYAAALQEAERRIMGNAIYCTITRDDAERWDSEDAKQHWYLYNARIDAVIALAREAYSL